MKINNWTFIITSVSQTIFDQHSQDFINEINDIFSCYNLYNNKKKSVFYRTLQRIPFIWWVFPQESRIYLSSPNLSQETYLSQSSNYLEKLKNFSFDTAACDLELSIGEDAVALLESSPLPESFMQWCKSIQNNINLYHPKLMEIPSDWGLLLTADYEVLRINILKFLAILPSLNHDIEGTQIKRLWLETLNSVLNDNNHLLLTTHQSDVLPKKLLIPINFGLKISKILPKFFYTNPLRYIVKKMASRFVAADNMKSTFSILNDLYKTNRCATIDQLGELVVSEKEADIYFNQILEIIEQFKSWPHTKERNKANLPFAHISLKVTALCARLNPHDLEYGRKRILPRLTIILHQAKLANIFVQIDAEHYSVRDYVFELYKQALTENTFLHDYADTGIVLQAYLTDSYIHFKQILELAKIRKLTMPIRLVKGAYWDAETISATANHHNAPQFIHKSETDGNFRFLVQEILKSSPHLQLCLASHNLIDHAYAQSLYTNQYPQSLPIEHQCLHMTYEALSRALANIGLAVRNYVPLGDLLVGMAYLVRRIMENSSQVGFLAQMRKKTTKEIKNFHNSFIPQPFDKKINELYLFNQGKFSPTPPLRFFLNHEKILINKNIKLDCENISYDEAKKIIQSKWNIDSAPKATIEVFIRCAQNILSAREELINIMIKEANKTPIEAMHDVNEAIDFINFYARAQAQLYKKYQNIHPRGDVAVISPWNFPLAIPCGMTTAGLVAGNRVFLKSSELTKNIAQKMVDLFYLAGVPKDQLIHLPGSGSVIGQLLIDSPTIATYVFTGSAKIGQYLYQSVTSRILEHPHGLMKVNAITEMGGKNAIIITDNCEIDEAITISLDSAFGHSGQKCSAASRLIIHEKVYPVFKQRIIQACKDLIVGESDSFLTNINPLISEKEQERVDTIVREIENTNDGKIILEIPNGPVLVEIEAQNAKNQDSWCQKEIFAPVIYLIPFNSLDQAIDIFNSSCYGLTGGIISQSSVDQEYIQSKILAGNIYINRNCTGARVGIEPFGGFKLSGTGPKAGHKDYLYSFNYFDQKNTHQEKINDYPVLTRENNFHIPGQISYNDYTLNINEMVFLIDQRVQQESTKHWLHYAKSLSIPHLVTTSKDFLNVQKYYPVIVIDSNKKDTEEFLKQYLYLKDMAKIFIAQDAPSINDPLMYFKSLTIPKSLAINIMRHGAPLAINS